MDINIQMNEEQKKWFDEFTKEDVIPKSTVEWILSVPKSGHKRLIEFPPSCVVVSKGGTFIPGDGKLGIVINLLDDGSELKVVHCPADSGLALAAMCRPEDLRVIGYWKGLNSEKVRGILGEHDINI